MICILLLLLLTSCVCAGTFVVNVTQSSYQAEENANITLEWTFTTNAGRPPDSLYIFCYLINHKIFNLFHLHGGAEVPESQDQQFAGRVQCDKDVLREGRVRLHVSRLRTEDSGLYRCDVFTDDGRSSDRCLLTVTAADDEPKAQRPTVRPEPEGPERTRIGLYVGLSAALLVVCSGLCFAFRLYYMKSTEKGNVSADEQMLSFSEKKPSGPSGPGLEDLFLSSDKDLNHKPTNRL